MFQIKPPKLVLLKFAFKRLYALKAIAVVAFISLVFASIYLCYWGQSTAYAATDSTVNFQARLMNATGSIVPDGCYNIQFKLYNVATGGSPLWTESYTNATATTGINGTCIAAGASSDDRLQVINGYVTVPLGSLTAFPTTINWNQSLYLTMNVGGTTGGAITYDGEMTPRLQLTAVPYAFQAGQLASSANSGGYNSTLSLVQPASGVTGNETFTIPDQGAAGAYTLLTSTAANAAYIQNGTSLQASSNFNISGTGQAGTFIAKPASDSLSTPSLKVETSTGNNVLTVAYGTYTQVGIGLGGTNLPTLSGNGLQIQGAIELDGGATAGDTDTFTTPVGANIQTKISIPTYDPGAFGQILAFGLPSTANTSARALSLFDDRSGTHQPTLALFSPNENQVFGLSWDGSNTESLIKTSVNDLGLQVNSLTALTVQNSTGTPAVGVGIVTNPQYTLDVGGDINTSTQYRIGGTVICTSSGCTPASGSGNYIQNGTSLQASSNFNISGTGQAGTGFLSPSLDALSGGTLTIGGTNATTITIGNTSFSSGTRTINIGTNATSGGTTNVTVGSQIGSSGTTIQGGTGSINLITNQSSSASVIIKTNTNTSNAFLIRNSSGIQAFTINTVAAGTSTSNEQITLGNITSGSGQGIAGQMTFADGSNDNFDATLTGNGSGNDSAYYTAYQSIIIPNASGTICLNSGNCSAAGGYIVNGTSLQASSNFNISGTGQAGTGFLSPSLDALSGGTLTIGGTNATTITIGRTAAALNLQGSAVTISSAAAATFSTVSGNLTLQAGSGTVTLGSSTTLTATGALGITSGGANALTLDTGGGAALSIGTSNASSVSLAKTGVTTTLNGGIIFVPSTGFSSGTNATITASLLTNNSAVPVTATASGLTFTLPTTGIGSAGRIVYLTNAGSNSFLLNTGSTVMNFLTTSTATLYWNGTAWSSAGLDAGVTAMGALDGQAANSNGATILDNTLYLQSASATAPGLVNTTTQTLAGAKTFTSPLTVQTTTNSTTALQVQNAIGEPIFAVDTTTTDLVNNPGFEVNTTGWAGSGTGASVARNTTKSTVYFGQASLAATLGSGSGTGASTNSFTASITPGTYELSFYAMGNATLSGLAVTLTGGGAPACTLNSTTVSASGFQQYYCSFTSTSTNVTAIAFTVTTTSKILYLDSVQLITGSTLNPYQIGAIQLRGVITNPVAFEATSNSTTAFQIQNAGSVSVLNVDTLDNNVTLGTNTDLYLTGSTAYISNPQGQSNSEAFGAGATVSNSFATALGNGALVSGYGSTAVGSGALASGTYGTSLGKGSNAVGNDSLALGGGAYAGTGSIALGYTASATLANQLVIGSSTANGAYIQNAYIGSGVTDATPQNVTLQGTGGSGTNIGGATFNLAGGKGTGTGVGGNINFQIAKPSAVSGTTLNSLTTVASLSGTNGAATFENTTNSTTAFQVQTSGGSDMLDVDTTDGFVGIGTNSPQIELDVVGGIQQTGLTTSNTSSTYAGEWTELGSCTLPAQYESCETTINIIGGSDGNTPDNTQATVSVRVKQQNAFGGTPIVNVTVNNTAEVVSSSDFAAVTTQDTPSTVVQLWAKIPNAYEGWNYTSTMNTQLYTGVAGWIWTPSSTFRTSLPSGVQTTNAIYGDSYANTLLVQTTANTTNTFQVLNSTGANMLNVDSTDNTVTLLQNAQVSTSSAGACGTNYNFTVADSLTSPNESVRWRDNTCGANLESGGTDVYLSGWSNANFTGNQDFYLRGVVADGDLWLGDADSNGTSNPISGSDGVAALVLDSTASGTTGDPTNAFNGEMYYNTNMNEFRCYQASVWRDCVSAVQSWNTNGVAVSGTTTSATYANYPGSSATLNFTKAASPTKLLVSINVDPWVSGTGSDLVGIDVRIAGTDYACTQFFFNSITVHQDISCSVIVTGIASGAQTAQIRWSRISGTGTVNADADTWSSMTVQETD